MIDSGTLAGRQTRDGMRLNRKDVETQRNRPLESPDRKRTGE